LQTLTPIKTMKYILPIIILWIIAAPITKACSCMGGSDFISTISDNNFSPDLIVRGVKTNDHYYGMNFRIKEVLKGQETRSVINIWGDNGALCRVYTSGFLTGGELILALYKTDQMGNSIRASEYPENLEREGDYHLSICGAHFLEVKNNQVNGAITTSKTHMYYAEFKKLIGVSEPTLPEGEALMLYPNPAPSGQFNITYHLPDVTELTISLYNVIGKEVKKFIVSLADEKGTIEVDAHTLSNGVYYVDIQAKGYRHQEKIIVW
jgi:hypothetical protein